jgi:hypothetical protein
MLADMRRIESLLCLNEKLPYPVQLSHILEESILRYGGIVLELAKTRTLRG